jgi:hypothetical protein
MKSRKPALTSPSTPSTRATMCIGQLLRAQRQPPASTAPASAPTAAASLRVRPRPRRRGIAAAAACSNVARHRAPRSRSRRRRWSGSRRPPPAAAPARPPPDAPAPSIAAGHVWAPISGSVPCARATQSARMSAKLPSSGIMACCPRYCLMVWLAASLPPCWPLRARARRRPPWRLPAACSSRRAWRALRGGEHAVVAELALRDDAFALAEEVRQDSLVGHGHVLVGVGDDEAHA